jgi:hypothetical protein
MRRKLVTTVAVTVGLILAVRFGPVQAQFDMPKPGPEHKVLDPLVGTWQAKVKFWLDPDAKPMEAEGTMNRKWIMNGLWLEEKFEGKFFGMDFTGLGLTGYDPVKKKYTGTWIDSMTPMLTTTEGTYDAKAKTLTVTFEEVDLKGNKAKGRDTIRVVDDDHQVQEMYRTKEGGKEMKVMEINYSRAKK